MTEAESTDRALVGRMLAGQEEAFEEFFGGYFSRLYRFALVRLDRNADAAEEVVQAVMCRAVTKLETYRGEAALFTWLCSFCRHEIAAWYRRRNRAPQSIDLAEDSPEARAVLESLTGEEAWGPEDEVLRREVARLVQVTLDNLPRAYGDALEWKYIHGLSVREIAARLDLGTKAAESLLTRARRAFREGFSALAQVPWPFGSPTE